MTAVLSFLRARYAERSSRVQLVVLVLLALVGFGVVTTDQIESFAGKAALALAALGPLAGILFPDEKKPVDATLAVEAASQIARDAAARAVTAEQQVAVQRAAERLESAAADITRRLGL
jgi:hypothetical protein